MDDTNSYENRIDLSKFNELTNNILENVSRYILGQRNLLDLLMISIVSDEHVLIEGVPGVAKTLSAHLTAKSIDAGFKRIQFTPDLMPSDILGTTIYNMGKSEFEFNPGPVFTNIVLADEINRAPAKTQAALFEVMQERQASIDGVTHPMQRPFLVMATQNPIEQEGTYQLPEAQLDRFLFKINVDYPEFEHEVEMLTNKHQNKGQAEIDSIKPVMSTDAIIDAQNTVTTVHIDEKIIHYLAKIIRKTRNHPSLYLGASPRAAVLLMKAAKARAALHGNDFVTPSDIKFLAPPVLRHRLILTPEKDMEGATPDDVINGILEDIEVPK